MQVVTQDIQQAIRAAVKAQKISFRAFAVMCNLQPSALSRWLNDTSCSIGSGNWEKIFPYIKEYLPVEYRNAPPTTSKGLEDKIDDLLREAVAGLTPKQKLAALEAITNICR